MGTRAATYKGQLITRILVPTDGSGYALDAAIYAVQLARSLGAAATLLHVVEVLRLPMWVPGVDFVEQERFRQGLLEGGKAILKSAEKLFFDAGIPVDTELREGSPGETIVDVASQGKYDVVVIGRRGLGLAQSLLLGSVSDHVARNAPCPVLIVRGEWPGKPGRERDSDSDGQR